MSRELRQTGASSRRRAQTTWTPPATTTGLRWSLTVHQQRNLFATIGCRNQRKKNRFGQPWEFPELPEAYYTTSIDYRSQGVCFPRESVEKILVHATPEYWQDMKGYVNRVFPDSRFQKEYEEHDGLAMRVMAEMNLPVAYPCLPRAYHCGYYGYHSYGYGYGYGYGYSSKGYGYEAYGHEEPAAARASASH